MPWRNLTSTNDTPRRDYAIAGDERIGQRGLAVVDVCKNADVADGRWIVHDLLPVVKVPR